MKRTLVSLMIVALLATVTLAEDGMNMVGQAMGNSDVIVVHVGLSEPNNVAAWGLSIAHEPETMLGEQTTSFGIWGALQTDIVTLNEAAVPAQFRYLSVKAFLDVDLLYDFDHDRISVWPGTGVRIAPTKTMAFIAKAIYPLGDEGLPSPVDLNEVGGLFGMEIRF